MEAIDHLDLVVTSLERSLFFYRSLLEPLGYVHVGEIRGERGERVVYLSRHGGGGSLSLRERQSDAHPIPYDRYAVGIHHILEVFFLSRRLAADRSESRFDWRWRAGVGTTLEQLLACELTIAGLERSTVELRDSSDDRVLVAGTMEEAADDTELESLRGRRELLALLGELEAWTGEQLEPPAEWDDGDVGAMQYAVARIRKPLEDVTWTRQRLTVRDPKLPEDLEELHQLAMIRPIGIRPFDREVWIGHELLHLPQVKFDLVEEGGQEQVYIEPPSDPGHATLRLFPPEEGPPLPATAASRPATN